MKNIHLLPTTKEQHSIIRKNTGLLLVQTPRKEYSGTKLNLYITSDEEIKEGDWFLEKAGRQYPILWNGKDKLNYHCKKIILTTDQSLDGVQSIDNEFLEWFVKNPSCEEVEVADIWKMGIPSTHDSYQLIIPQEEPKQETLEEAAKEGYNNMPFGIGLIKRRSVFLLGAKWQAERMYSDEEVLELLLSRPGPYLTDEEIKEWFEQFKKK